MKGESSRTRSASSSTRHSLPASKMRRSRCLDYFFAASLLLSPLVDAAKPFRIPYETERGFGFDGPWNALKVNIGDPAQPLHMFPGRFLGIYLLNSTVCDEFDDCGETETYDQRKSKAWNKDVIVDNQSTRNGFLKGTKYGYFLNEMTFNYHERASVTEENGGGMKYTLNDASMAFIRRATVTFPGGLKVPVPLGYFTYGGPHDKHGIQDGKFEGTLMMNQMEMDGLTPSRTMGLHIGSTLLGQQGSMIFGGYDKSRVAAPPTSYTMKENDQFTLDLYNISLKYMNGKTRDEDLVISTTSEFSKASLPVYIEPTFPYMYLPEKICNDLVSKLPVEFDASLGLYIWDTSHKSYKAFVNAPHYLEFTFPSSRVNKIRVPLKLLTLQLSAPVSKTTKRYFPCRPLSDNKEGYTLGRAFLQAAYLAYNRHSNVFWLAQASGPGGGMTQRSEDMVALEKDAITFKGVSGDENAWESTWAAVWENADMGDAPEYAKVKGPTIEFDDVSNNDDDSEDEEEKPSSDSGDSKDRDDESNSNKPVKPKIRFDDGIDDESDAGDNKKLISGKISGVIETVPNKEGGSGGGVGNGGNGNGNGNGNGGGANGGPNSDGQVGGDSKDGDKKPISTGTAVGAAVGGVVGAGLVVALIVLLCRRKKRSEKWDNSQGWNSRRSSRIPWPRRPGSEGTSLAGAYGGAYAPSIEKNNSPNQDPFRVPGSEHPGYPQGQYPQQQGYGYNGSYPPSAGHTESSHGVYSAYPSSQGGQFAPGVPFPNEMGRNTMHEADSPYSDSDRTMIGAGGRFQNQGFGQHPPMPVRKGFASELDSTNAPVEIGPGNYVRHKPVELEAINQRADKIIN